MPFSDIRNRNPQLLCSCGHSADHHLYMGDHMCSKIECECGRFELDATLDNARILIREKTPPPASRGFQAESWPSLA